MKLLKVTFCLFLMVFCNYVFTQKNQNTVVIAYYTGDEKLIDNFDPSKLTHIIYSFCHLKDGKLNVDNKKDTLTIRKLVSLKNQFPELKIMLSLGGWGGCKDCSQTFSTEKGRLIFAKSVKETLTFFKCDGIDLDWEYPTIEGFPDHLYQKNDKQNFTDLIIKLRKQLGNKLELSFAAGGFQKFLDESVEWKKIMPLLDRVNLMSYDLVNGYSKITGNHTPIYSTTKNEESTDRAVKYLIKLGVPSKKIVIGGAFYTRIWKNVSSQNNGLYQTGEHINGVSFKDYETEFTKEKGWNYFWDDKSKSPYWYNLKEQKFATGDNIRSITEKTKYVLVNNLGGIMFWELTLDSSKNELVDAIYQTLHP